MYNQIIPQFPNECNEYSIILEYIVDLNDFELQNNCIDLLFRINPLNLHFTNEIKSKIIFTYVEMNKGHYIDVQIF